MTIYAIGALIGAIIGYITNWLAIKMLFRPREEKRIRGIKVPFTPGLIPKEKERIAKSVGSTVGEHILTTTVITKSLNKPEIKEKIKEVISDKVYSISDNSNLESLIEEIFGDGYHPFTENIKEKINNRILELISSKEFINSITSLVCNVIFSKLKKSPDLLHSYIKSGRLNKLITSLISKEKGTDEFKEIIKEIIITESNRLSSNNKKISEVIPKELIKVAEELVYKEKDFIAEQLVETLKEGSLSYKIKSIISENIPSIMTMFVSVESIYDKVVNMASTYFMQEENKKYICNSIVSVIHKGCEKKVSEILDGVSEEQFDEISLAIVELISDNVLNENEISKYISKLEQYLLDINSYDELFKKFNSKYEDLILNYVSISLNELINDKDLNGKLDLIITNFIDSILQIKINDICKDKDRLIESIFVVIEKYYDNFIEKDAMRVIESINIPMLVEEQINSFDVSYVEEIIISIANKELKAITWLGAILGAILGVLSPILSNLYM